MLSNIAVYLSGALIGIGSSEPSQNFNGTWDMINEYEKVLKTMPAGTKNCVKKTICLLHERQEFAKEIENSVETIKSIKTKADMGYLDARSLTSGDSLTYILDVDN